MVLIKNRIRAYFVTSGYPWFMRGAAPTDGVNAGVFAFNHHYGASWGNLSFRVVL